MVRRTERGSILVFTLCVLVCVSLIALGFGKRARLEMRAAAYEADKLAARMLARAAVEMGMAKLRENFAKLPLYHSLSDAWAQEETVQLDKVLPEASPEMVQSSTVTITIVDEGRKLNINRVDERFLLRFRLLPVSVANEIIGRRLGEDEEVSGDDYLFTVPEELVQFKGFDASDWFGDPEKDELRLCDALTVYGSSRVNINTVPPEILTAVPDLSRSDALRIIEYRRGRDGKDGTGDDRPFKQFDSLRKVRGIDRGKISVIERYCRLDSGVFTVTGKAQLHNERVTAVVQAVVRRDRGFGTRILAWREG